jgi:hypothetical protein
MPSTTPPTSQHKALISQLSAITSMERGTLVEEYRTQPSRDGKGTVRLGPYFKHQCWEGGKNRSSRVPAHQVPQLRADLENAEHFDRVSAQLASLATEQSRARRATMTPQSGAPDLAAVKKNSRSNASRSAIAKRRPSSRSSAKASRSKA